MGLLGTVALIALLLGVWPHWPYARRWGYVPGVAVGTLLAVWVLLVLMSGVPWWGWTPQAH